MRGLFAPTGDARQPALDGRRAALLGHFQDAGYKTVDTPILGPAATFLDFSGEAIRSRLFLTSDAAGRELCLRPEYTIPVCLAYLEADAGRQADYAYCGPVFRAEEGGPGQFLQAGLESSGAATRPPPTRDPGAGVAGGREGRLRRDRRPAGDAGLLSTLFEA